MNLVKRIAAQAGVGLDGVKLEIRKSAPRQKMFGQTTRDGVLRLFPSSEVTLCVAITQPGSVVHSNVSRPNGLIGDAGSSVDPTSNHFMMRLYGPVARAQLIQDLIQRRPGGHSPAGRLH